ncbi:MAG: type I phosphomannose isomerase catalytic subunit [Cytophagales bacterium]|nr:type I phosphomannose isomerase catalytic subunit [Cytophagales bacterium]
MSYPLTFVTQFKDKIWGGNKIKSILGKDYAPLPNCGETWEISGVKSNISIVKNGIWQGKSLQELLYEHKDKLVGAKVYEKYGTNFPLLVKFIDANDDLSIQVHPNDALALARHNSFGKSEMWYIMQADTGAKLNAGFSVPVTRESYLNHLNNRTLDKILNIEEVQSGDVYYMPAGRVHYIGKGILLAEIQQSSDVTYRIYDFDRVDDKGSKRELHTDQALDAIDYHHYPEYKTNYKITNNAPTSLVTSPYFITNLLKYNAIYTTELQNRDSFTIYICVEGSAHIVADGYDTTLNLGETVLIPASVSTIQIIPSPSYTLLETYVP